MQQELDDYCRERRSIFYAKSDLALPPQSLPGDNAQLEIARVSNAACADLFQGRLRRVAPLTDQGTFHRLFRAELADEGSAIVRVNAFSNWRRGFTMHLDGWAAGLLQPAAIPVPAVYEVDTSRRRHRYDYQVMEEARGVSLREFDSDDARIGPLLFELGRTVAQLHAIPGQHFGLIDVRPLVLGTHGAVAGGVLDSWPEYIKLNLHSHTETCARIGAVRAGEADQILDLFKSLESVLSDVQPVLLHGDLGNHNVFTDGTTVTALIDWEDCLTGDPVFDIAFWATFHPERRHDLFLQGYRSVRDLPADFELRFWLYFLRTALSKTVLRHRFGLKDKPGRPPASLRIQRGVEKVTAAVGVAQAA